MKLKFSKENGRYKTKGVVSETTGFFVNTNSNILEHLERVKESLIRAYELHSKN